MNIDWSSGVITIYRTDPFVSFAGGSVYNMDTNAFRLALKDAEDSPVGMVFPDTHRHNTAVLLGGIEYARIIEMLPPYSITFDDAGGAWVCNLIGSNNNILDLTNLTTVQVRSNNSAGLVQMQEIQFGSFLNGVTLDVVNGFSGTGYPLGTRRRPVNNMGDAMTIATLYGFGKIYVIGDAIIDASGSYEGISFEGESKSKTTLSILAAANVFRCEFYEARVDGVLDGDCLLQNCVVDELSYVSGFIEDCVLANTITLGGTSVANFLDCYSGSGSSPPVIDCGGDGPELALRNFNGRVTIRNKTGSAPVTVDLNSGVVTLEPTVVSGSIVVRGVGSLVDVSGNSIPSGTWNGCTIDNGTVNTDGIVSGMSGSVIQANLVQVNSQSIGGTGTEQNPWGPV